MSPKQTMDTGSRSVAGWLLHSGIQEANGGVARYRRSDLGRNEPVSTEITGYTVSAMVYLHGRSGDPDLLSGAQRAADFLIQHAWDPGLSIFPFELPDPSRETLAYFFDSGIIVRGFLALHRVTGDTRYLEAAMRGGASMIRHFRDADGVLHPILKLPSLAPLPRTSQWSRSPGCYQLKSAMAWHDLSAASDDPAWEIPWNAAVEQALASHEAFLPAESASRTMDRLHAYCYFLEALLAVAEHPSIRAVLAEGIVRVAGYLAEIRPEFERSDVNAQLLRVRLYAAALAGIDLDLPAATAEAERIAEFQAPTGPEQGGFWFGRKQGVLIPHANPVSSAFCAQALEMWSDSRRGIAPSLSDLV